MPQPAPQNNHVTIKRVALSSNTQAPADNPHLIKSIPDGPSHEIQISTGPSYSDHPLVLGNRYCPSDLRLVGTGPVSPEVSGVHCKLIFHLITHR